MTIKKIRSFVRREGRLTKAQEHALQYYWPQFGKQLSEGRFETANRSDNRPRVLEIGYGMGTSLLKMAQQAPDHDFIGIEVHRPGVGALLHQATKQEINNIYTYREDAVEVLEHCIDDASLNKVQVFFPDPWPKKRHHKRRLIQTPFIDLLCQKLAPGGQIHLATDWQPYAEHMLDVLSNHDGLKNTATPDSQGFIPRPETRPVTKFEQRGFDLGHSSWDLLFEKSL